MLMAVVLVACSGDDATTINTDGVDDGYWLTLSLNNAATRAAADHPYGGDDGDGREYGRNFENNIDDVCIFIYDDADGKGVNGEASTPIKAKYYFSGLGLSLPEGISYKTSPMKINGYKPSANDRLIVFANTGDVTADFSTLADFQSTSKAWQKTMLWNDDADALKCDHFVMTTSREDDTYGKMNVTGLTGAINDPFNATIEMQRAMARVDIMFKSDNASTVVDGPLSFTVDAGTSSGTFMLTKARIFNMPLESTLPLKRVAATADLAGLNSATLLGSETTLPYVHTKWTYDKEKETYETATSFQASTGVDDDGIATYLPNGTTDYSVHACPSDNHVFTVSETDFADYKYSYTVGYCPENTMPLEMQTNDYRTGVLLRGTFMPTHIYKYSGGLVEDDAYTAGNDMWRYVAVETGDQSYFFSSEADIDAYIASRPTKAYNKVKYTQGQCYYYIWIKHVAPASGAAENTTPMEYAIVRNNIYRIGIEKITGIGSEVPSPKSNANTKIYVRNWRFRGQEEIVL